MSLHLLASAESTLAHAPSAEGSRSHVAKLPRTLGTTLLLLACCSASLGAEHGLTGKWISDDDKMVVALAPCPTNSATICATILEEVRPSGERSRVGEMIGVDFVAQADGSWLGEVVGISGKRLPAKLTTPEPGQFDMRVCFLSIICDGVSYFKTAP